ncbi:aspartate/glutamate racemase family protein [Paenibacillus vietnamensis]|uniref:aspartate/glutamate racemase family protein n=1 Tax=Paenibacillus vietnamensis TaxID=2590547 RepID=UPI001CD073D0|nr:aspartate/glutamate racemase family protein [Paenibacillus vietnamensis]
MNKIACLHAHYSNIEYIQKAVDASKVDLVHYVDPGLMGRMMSSTQFDRSQACEKVIEQIRWMTQPDVDALLITCTNYIALLDEDRLAAAIPIIKIDEPFFHHVCRINEPQVILFTNPATVEGTMNRLYTYAAEQGLTLNDIHPRVIDHTFELIMQGKKEQYKNEVASGIKTLLSNDERVKISVAQLSMADAAEIVEREMGVEIGNPLKTLAASFR